jgi:hypothetical protein
MGDMSKVTQGETTVLLHDAWLGVPPQSTEPGMERFSVPVRIFSGDPDNPKHGVARFDYLVGWIDPWSLEPLDQGVDVLGWGELPEDVLASLRPTEPPN